MYTGMNTERKEDVPLGPPNADITNE